MLLPLLEKDHSIGTRLYKHCLKWCNDNKTIKFLRSVMRIFFSIAGKNINLAFMFIWDTN